MSADWAYHPGIGYWQGLGMRYGLAAAASKHGARTPYDPEWYARAERIRNAKARGELWVYDEFGPYSPLEDDDAFVSVFEAPRSKVPADWVVAFEFGFMSGWWSCLA